MAAPSVHCCSPGKGLKISGSNTALKGARPTYFLAGTLESVGSLGKEAKLVASTPKSIGCV